jgi:hypothetical protein
MTASLDSKVALRTAYLAGAGVAASGPDTVMLRLVAEFDSLTAAVHASFDFFKSESREQEAERTAYIAVLSARQDEIKDMIWDHQPKTMEGVQALGRAICNDVPEVLTGQYLVDAGSYLDSSLVNVLLHALAA